MITGGTASWRKTANKATSPFLVLQYVEVQSLHSFLKYQKRKLQHKVTSVSSNIALLRKILAASGCALFAEPEKRQGTSQ